MFEYSAAGASSSSYASYWVEAGLLSDNTLVRRRGNIYIVAEGLAAECDLAVKAIRDQYYGDISQTQGGTSAALRLSMEAANLLLYRKSGIGASCVCAAASEWGQLCLLRAGDCHAFLFSGQDGELFRLGERQTADRALGRSADPQVSEIKRVLKDKDVLIFCSGALADGLREAEIASITSLHLAAGPEEVAKRLIETASLRGTGGTSAALVVVCQTVDAGIHPTSPLETEFESRLESVAGPAGKGRRSLLERVEIGLRLPRPGSFGQVPVIAGALALLVAAFLLARPLLPGASSEEGFLTATAENRTEIEAAGEEVQAGAASVQPYPEPSVADELAVMRPTVEAIWRKGEWGGSDDSRKTIVSTVERLQSRAPEDQGVAETMKKAMTNQIYAGFMLEVADAWGKAGTSTQPTGWANVVKKLEELRAYSLPYPLSPEQRAMAEEKLYAAYLSYSKALERANQSAEAARQRQKAQELKSKGWLAR